jgi:hypothetical protein
MDRAPDYGSGGWGFKSLRARQIDRYIQFPLSGVSLCAPTSLARSVRVVLAASIRGSLVVSEQGSVRCRERVLAVSPAGFGARQVVIKSLDVKILLSLGRAPSAVGASVTHAHNLSGARTTRVTRT